MTLSKTKDRTQINARLRRISAERSLKGLCTKCSGEVKAEIGKTLCSKHLEELRQRALRRTIHRRASRLCTTCGAPSDEGLASCSKCLARASKDARERCARAKRRIIEHLGGKCQRCGLITEYTSVYEVHHLSKRNKEFNLKNLHLKTWGKILAELNKGVQLLCANCHRIVQYEHRESWANK